MTIGQSDVGNSSVETFFPGGSWLCLVDNETNQHSGKCQNVRQSKREVGLVVFRMSHCPEHRQSGERLRGWVLVQSVKGLLYEYEDLNRITKIQAMMYDL